MSFPCDAFPSGTVCVDEEEDSMRVLLPFFHSSSPSICLPWQPVRQGQREGTGRDTLSHPIPLLLSAKRVVYCHCLSPRLQLPFASNGLKEPRLQKIHGERDATGVTRTRGRKVLGKEIRLPVPKYGSETPGRGPGRSDDLNYFPCLMRINSTFHLPFDPRNHPPSFIPDS